MRQQLLAKQQELLKLQQQRLELELAEAKSRLENQEMELKAKKVTEEVEKFKVILTLYIVTQVSVFKSDRLNNSGEINTSLNWKSISFSSIFRRQLLKKP